jgi:hypothetical protein
MLLGRSYIYPALLAFEVTHQSSDPDRAFPDLQAGIKIDALWESLWALRRWYSDLLGFVEHLNRDLNDRVNEHELYIRRLRTENRDLRNRLASPMP